jgi:branched-chain amino acid transport system permease protein
MSGRNGLALVLAAGVALGVAPVFLSSGHMLDLAVVGAYTIAILGVGHLLAESGRSSLGQGGFMALGGYATAILCVNHGVGELPTVLAAAGVAGAAGVAAGLLSLRLGAYSPGIVTLGLALVVPHIALRFATFTGGAAGLALPGGSFAARQAYAVTWVTAGVLFLLAWALARSRFGRGLRAVRDNPVGAAAGGVNPSMYAVASFALSGAYGGVAGSLLVINLGRVGPGTFPLRLSLLLLAGAAVAGLGSVWGAPVAALLIRYLTDVTGWLPHIGANRPGPTTFLFGAAVIALVVGRGLAATLAGRDRFGRAKRAGP